MNNYGTLRNQLKVGDVVELTTNQYTTRTHAMIVYNINSTNIVLAAHSSSTNSTPLMSLASSSNYNDSMFAIIRIKSGS